MIQITLRAQRPFSLHGVIFSHGWSDLPPFSVEKKDGTFKSAIRTSKGPIAIRVQPISKGITVEAPHWDTSIEKDLRWMLKMDEPMDSFYKKANAWDRPWIQKQNMGRLLRSQTIFEDLIKLVLTTNCSWSFTRIMASRLTQELGEKTPEGVSLFPSAEIMARKNETFYRETIRAGYRSPNLVKLSKMVASKKIKLEHWKDTQIPTDQIRNEILNLPGAGPYVADNLLRYLGRYDRLGLDSWARQKLKEIWKMKKNPTDKTIEKRYKKFENYRGLILWCDLTQDWFTKKS